MSLLLSFLLVDKKYPIYYSIYYSFFTVCIALPNTVSKISLLITRAFQRETPKLKLWLRFMISSSFGRKSESSPHHACAIFWLGRMDNVLSKKHMAGCNGGRQEAFGVQNQHRHCVKTLKTYTKYRSRKTNTKRCRAFSERVGPRTLWVISL